MKQNIFICGIALSAAFCLAGCTRQLDSPEALPQGGIPFEVSALITKTANDGLVTKWASGDAINLFHAVAGTSEYVSDGEFVLADPEAGTFSGKLASELDVDKSYDWYAIYPYSASNTTPAAGSVTVGGASQTQSGNGSLAHICGPVCPLRGVAKDVTTDQKPSFQMENLASLIRVRITNSLAIDLVVSQISFTSSENIVGTYSVDVTAADPVYTAVAAESTASLGVSGGAAIAKDASADFYIAVKPHTVTAESSLILSVNGMEKTCIMDKDMTFTAGRIKSLTYDFTPSINELYILGDATDAGWDLNAMAAFSNENGIFTWKGSLRASGAFRFPLQKVAGAWFPCLCLQKSTSKLVKTTDADWNTGGYQHLTVPEDGAYQIVINAQDESDITYTITRIYENPLTELYILGDATDTGWNLDTMPAFTNENGIFTWQGNLKGSGAFRFPLQKISGVWFPCLCLQKSTGKLVKTTDTDWNTGGYQHLTVAEDGVYKIVVNGQNADDVSYTITKL